MTASSQSRSLASDQHPLGKDPSIPKKIDEDRLAYLTARIRTGCITPEEREELARGFIRLALTIASGYASRRPDKADDFASAGLFGIVYALDKAQEKMYDDNITGWVVSNIKRFIRRFYETDHMVRVPSTTYHKSKSEGKSVETVSVTVMDPNELNSGTSDFFHHMKAKPTGNVFELKEILRLSARSEIDRTILQMRSEGYTNAEIAAKIGVSTCYVQKKRAKIEARFDELNSGG